MAKRKAKKKPLPARAPSGRFVAVKGMTPAEVQAWRNQELRERAKEAKARDEARRAAGKPGRARGKKRFMREAESAQRRKEVAFQVAERKRRVEVSRPTRRAFWVSRAGLVTW